MHYVHSHRFCDILLVLYVPQPITIQGTVIYTLPRQVYSASHNRYSLVKRWRNRFFVPTIPQSILPDNVRYNTIYDTIEVNISRRAAVQVWPKFGRISPLNGGREVEFLIVEGYERQEAKLSLG